MHAPWQARATEYEYNAVYVPLESRHAYKTRKPTGNWLRGVRDTAAAEQSGDDATEFQLAIRIGVR
ncbi:hypothetical protein MYCTH_2299362 [Thermothelomyces thermophilus ATCC 42464]|uniref:Uncharacterized protein n=1 Tax=Thermothelomyces thermophilus (strain ATCC 42464 / BCRC 31852 / DSM 1799) TaxID=573729 RepID=G2Q5Q0_THET4|nr:uncharacterized protein MYCTH_2299362 [Thermothelomyces thermophilus ATCC 42464]AEO55486.1 hypothetical protein MYCTH_2299362 [Thermothelomyces thermophilus ATCC 42464]